MIESFQREAERSLNVRCVPVQTLVKRALPPRLNNHLHHKILPTRKEGLGKTQTQVRSLCIGRAPC
jgi:hypothetical protein